MQFYSSTFVLHTNQVLEWWTFWFQGHKKEKGVSNVNMLAYSLLEGSIWCQIFFYVKLPYINILIGINSMGRAAAPWNIIDSIIPFQLLSYLMLSFSWLDFNWKTVYAIFINGEPLVHLILATKHTSGLFGRILINMLVKYGLLAEIILNVWILMMAQQPPFPNPS